MALIESILVIIVIAIVLVIIYNVFFTKSNLLISGIVPTTPTTIIDAKHLQSNISSNFAWSIWFYINEWNEGYGHYKDLFYQGNRAGTKYNIQTRFTSFENNLEIKLTTYRTEVDHYQNSEYQENKFYVPNIDLQKWVNLIISVEGRTLDIYLHGKLVRTFVLPNTAYIKTGENVYIGNNDTNGTFDGHVARFQYFANSVNTQQAYNIYKDGLDSNLISDFFNKYRLKIQFLEYSNPVGQALVI